MTELLQYTLQFLKELLCEVDITSGLSHHCSQRLRFKTFSSPVIVSMKKTQL